METITDAKLTLKTETCPLCHGWGELEGYAGVNKMTCFKCKGTGREKIYQLTTQQGAHIMNKQDNQKNDSNLDLSAADELLALKLEIKNFCIEFDKTSWGWDGDCGTQCLVDDLAETVQDKYGNWTC